MSLVEYLRRQFAYDAWANREVFAAIGVNGGSDERSMRLLAHILSAERLWLERITEQPQSLPVWPKPDLAQCETQIAELASLWREFLKDADDSGLSHAVSYKNSKGEPWTSTLQDILTHVLMHSAYHRGQIASHMRERGNAPAYTDFIHAVRQGLIR
jgi:uncharacterized damage-inducible protein DinB